MVGIEHTSGKLSSTIAPTAPALAAASTKLCPSPFSVS